MIQKQDVAVVAKEIEKEFSSSSKPPPKLSLVAQGFAYVAECAHDSDDG
jgi:hypothetical protein